MIAWAALILWPITSITYLRKFSLPVALCVTFLGGYLLLPEKVGLNLPVLPTLDKHSIPTLIALVLTVVMVGQKSQSSYVLNGWLPRSPTALFFMSLLFIGVFGMVLTNQDALFFGPLVLPGMKLYDGFAFSLIFVVALIPMLLARKVLATPEAQRILLLVLTISALLYTIPTLWEVRMSPQLHRQVYGFFQHSFIQSVRADGFRALVFLGHGLSLAIFLSIAVLSAIALMRTSEKKMHMKWLMAAGWLFVVLILSKSLGALMITVLLVPLVLFLRARTQLLVAACIAGIVMTYPLLRAADLLPVDRVMSFAENVDPQRARSLNTRLVNEEALLEKARQRPVFGWGGWSRNRIFDQRGRNLSITDGEWILHIGIGGWVRYIGFFGLLCWPIIGLFMSKRDRIDPVCAMLSLVLCAKLIDFIPNTGMVPYVWLIVGSLWGRLELSVAAMKPSETTQGAPEQTRVQYARPLRDPADPTRVGTALASSDDARVYTRAQNRMFPSRK